MNEPSKMPYEPVPMPDMPAMPPMPEMPKPSFSRSTNPPAPPPPIQRKPLAIADEKPNPFPTPSGIAPEAPAVVPAEPTVTKSSGFPLSWLKPSRTKGIVIAGVASLGIGAFGLNALVPMPVSDPPKGGPAHDSAAAPPVKAPPAPVPMPKITEHRHPVEAPVLGSPFAADDRTASESFTRVEATTPAPPPVSPPLRNPDAVKGPLEPPAIPGASLTLPTMPADTGLPKPISEPPPIGLPPSIPSTLPAVKPFEDAPTGLPVPPPLEPVVPATPKPADSPKPLPPVLTPIDVAKPLPVTPLPAPMKPQPQIEIAVPELKPPTPVEVKPLPEPMLLPSPFAEKPKPVEPAAVEAKTDYDVDIYKLRSGDTYQSISQKFYGTANYAAALRGYNDGAEPSRLRDVQVPPMHVIKKFGTGREPAEAPRVAPAGGTQDPKLGSERDVQWGTPGTRRAGDSPADDQPRWR